MKQLEINQMIQRQTPEFLHTIWPNFKKVAFAIYDENDVYVFHHPKFPNEQYFKIPKDERFIADGLLIFEDYPTAIVDKNRYETFPQLMAIVVHELFHGFQYLQDEKRFPNEISGVMYTEDAQNIAYRVKERALLADAILLKNEFEKLQALKQFIAIRKKRAILFSEFVQYEQLMESIEGPAFYCELKTYLLVTNQTVDDVFHLYGKSLIDAKESMLAIRKSCYDSGLFICLALDKWRPDWKEQFFDEQLTVFELLEQIGDFNIDVEVECNEDAYTIAEIMNQHKEQQVQQFFNNNNYLVEIKGPLKITSVDPMNMTHWHDNVLHKHFVKIKLQEKEVTLLQPVLTRICDGDLWHISSIQFYSTEKPTVKRNKHIIRELGEIDTASYQVAVK
ncbi:hypothetical protein CSE16_07800 [Solibacillus sp. R5-41]|uniref:hypothetical protein n=1 Tax=Solibacillus sp. R5-41 TaxID=2048654 RepID=UPI000C127EF2|nr:hypothetical protein [Solibacillus sp. R5-41]ATP39961.1 hypothetical protein CSE16_07800 [Solibacillus sp. R5-41]